MVEGGSTLGVHHFSQHCYKMHAKGNFRKEEFVLVHGWKTQSTLEEKLWQSLQRLEDWCSAGFLLVRSGTSVHEVLSHIQSGFSTSANLIYSIHCSWVQKLATLETLEPDILSTSTAIHVEQTNFTFHLSI